MNKDLLLTDFFPKILSVECSIDEASLFRSRFELIFDYSVQVIKIAERPIYRKYESDYEIIFYITIFDEECKEIQIKDLDSSHYYLNNKDIAYLWENKHYLDNRIFVQLEQHFKKFDIIT